MIVADSALLSSHPSPSLKKILLPTWGTTSKLQVHPALDHPQSTQPARFYQGYVSFFAQKASEKGIANTLEEFVFSEQYNFRKGEDADAQPELLSHFLQGLVHPMIHVGYGVEFGLKGMVVEGMHSVTCYT